MNQKITLRFADHVLTFVVPEAEVAEITLAFRREWPYKFVRADGDFHVDFDQVSWMKISPGDDTETKQETVETAQEEMEQHRIPFSAPTPSWPAGLPRGGTHGSL